MRAMQTLLVSLVTFFTVSSFAAEITDVTPAQVASNEAKDWVILDVRSPEEFEAGHVPNAINIPHTEIADNIERLLGHINKPVVVYCRSGFRAAKAGNILIENGFSQVKHLDGDMQGWEKSGNPIEK